MDQYRIICARDEQYDDRFVFAVTTTGIYCRPSCPAKRPLRKNCRFFDTGKLAESHGFRPCKRCQPNRQKDYASARIQEYIDRLDLGEAPRSAEFAQASHLSERQLRRLIKQQTGYTLTQLMQRKRLLLAKRLLITTDLPIVDIAFRAEFTSLRQRLQASLDPIVVQAEHDSHDYAKRVQAYFAGDLTALDTIPTMQVGSPFFQRIWQAMRAIPAGKTYTYTELATAAGSPAAVRAAGTACGRNKLILLIPCHRIIRSDGGLGGYVYGPRIKQALLAHEEAMARRQPLSSAR